MNPHEKVMEHANQLAFLLNITHGEFSQQVQLNLIPETETFDEWLEFVIAEAPKLCVPDPRSSEWPL